MPPDKKPNCAYCADTRKCPTCRGEGYFTVYQNVPPYEYDEACPDCNGLKTCQACAVRDERRLINRNGTL